MTVIFEEKKPPEHESPRTSWGLCRISNSGYAYSCTDVTFPLGFTSDECQMLATRQRATNYLFHMYTDRGRPVQSAQRSKSSNSSSWQIKSPGEKDAIKMAAPFWRKEDSLKLLNKRDCSSAVPWRKEKGNRITAPRRESLAKETEASIHDSPAKIMIRSMNKDLSPSARLERYLINLQRAGFLTSASKEKRQSSQVELDRRITQTGREVSLRSKFLPHPPVYLFERAVKDSPFNS